MRDGYPERDLAAWSEDFGERSGLRSDEIRLREYDSRAENVTNKLSRVTKLVYAQNRSDS